MPTLAAVSIGQCPRPDLVGRLLTVLPEGTELLEFGALDGLDAADIAPLAGAGNPLSTRLADGSRILVDEEWLAPLVQSALDRADDRGAEATLLLCAGGFEDLRSRGRLVRPVEAAADELRAAGIDSILVVVPSAAQIEASRRKWRGFGFDPRMSPAVLPAQTAAVAQAADGLGAVVLDYVGHPPVVIDRLEAALATANGIRLIDLGQAGELALVATLTNAGAPA